MPSLEVSTPGDPLEREADRVADAVTAAEPVETSGSALTAGTSGAQVQRCGPGAEDCDCAEDETLQREATSAGVTPAEAPPSVAQVLASGGEPLEAPVRRALQAGFGYEFGDVRIHRDALAQHSASEVGARAYTVGKDIAFASSQYAPQTTAGRRLLAHELTHVVQQGSARPSSSKNLVSRLADSASAPRLRASGPLIQRQAVPGVHSGGSRGSSGVPSEKWSEDVERAYRRAGLVEAANAVAGCREWGACDRLLTQSEAWEAYRTGRVKGKLGDPPEKSRPTGMTANVAVAGVVAPVAVGGSAEAAAAKTALERAAVRWGTAGSLEGGAATGTAAGVSTVAVPIAIGVAAVLAIADLISYTSFQIALQRQGYFILPEPLAVCIGNCHQPTAPTFRPLPRLPEPPPLLLPRQFDPKDIEKLKDMLDKTAPKPGPTPGPVPKPEPKPREDEDQRKRCRLVLRTVGRGDDPLADHYCGVVAPMGQSYDIYSPVGVTEIDALAGRTWYECKCGYKTLIRALERGIWWAPYALDKFDEQVRRQNRIAAYCGYQYLLVASNRRVEEFLRDRHPDITILLVDWDPCP